MSSSNNSPARRRGNDRILTIDWSLLWRRARNRAGQLFTSLRHRMGRTEYIPPVWMQRFRLTWFRVGLMCLAAFVFTQKQVDFTVSVGKEGFAAGQPMGRHMAARQEGSSPRATNTMSLMPGLGGSTSSPSESWSVDKLDERAVRGYISRFERVAQGEEKKFSIPAPAKMALGILLSNAGQSPAAKKDNNHFGLSAGARYFDNAWMNWRAHSEYVQQNFPELANESVNYQQWLAALAKTNYSTDRKLVSKLMDIIERYQLDRL
ncbi:glucosaminidase domain-containing protein [Neolewinella agarilytica]|uniref:glucosaminidase domain-containing protein n=1 Tax=Neolewinella agarilytica TaxID=478744 RepID=UPI0023537B17|nr:glucosaminidase domain-containing protein [Neolewinella agarilytica]